MHHRPRGRWWREATGTDSATHADPPDRWSNHDPRRRVLHWHGRRGHAGPMSQILEPTDQRTPACVADGCAKPRFNVSSGLCSMHYYRVKRHGTLAGHTPRDHLPTRLARYVWTDGPTVWMALLGCWEWTGARTGRDGRYGRTTIDGQTTTAHRAMLIASARERGEDWDDELEVHHRCENPACVNPAHLEAISWAEHCAEHGWDGGSAEAAAARMSRRGWTDEYEEWFDNLETF